MSPCKHCYNYVGHRPWCAGRTFRASDKDYDLPSFLVPNAEDRPSKPLQDKAKEIVKKAAAVRKRSGPPSRPALYAPIPKGYWGPEPEAERPMCSSEEAEARNWARYRRGIEQYKAFLAGG